MNVAVALAGFAVGVVLTWLVINLGSGEKRIEQALERLYAVEDPAFRRALDVLLGPSILEGNRVEVLLNGDRIFASMLQAIASAQRTITFETYIYWSGTIGREFAEALCERARDGVTVHLLLDWIGSAKVEARDIDEMKRCGVEVERFHAPHWTRLPRLNNRTHRKLLVVDGTVAFTGGVGIADPWRGDAEDADHWRDTHFRVEGPVVAQMQSVFIDNWTKATERTLHGDRYFPPLEARGAEPAQMFSSSPSGGSESMHLMYLLAITAADRSIDLSSAYFVPDDLTVAAIVAAAKRGVRVRIITPGRHIDSALVRRASRARWGPLLEAGVTLAEYQPTMYHCKVLIVDALLVSVGSTNFDNRSFRLNDEANLNVLSADFARPQVQVFEDDLAKAQPLSFADWKARPWREKLAERLASLIREQL